MLDPVPVAHCDDAAYGGVPLPYSGFDVGWIMQAGNTKRALELVAGLLVAVALFVAGRATADTSAGHARTSQTALSDQYFAGLRAGEAQGRQEGRALQEGLSLPANSRRPATAAFNAGYTAGANDAFAGYDGGWTFSAPYVVTLKQGTGQIIYRIDLRTPITAGVNYYLCPDGHDICHQRRH